MATHLAPEASPLDRPNARLSPGPPARPPSRAGQRLGLWVRSHGWSIATLTVLMTVIAVVYWSGLSTYPRRVDDEGTYVAQAWAVQHWHVLSHYTYWYDHPPLGWILIAGWTWVTHAWDRVRYGVTAGREVMVLAHLLSCALMYVLVRRLDIRRSLAAVAIVLFSFSPLALVYHRMVYLDNLATPFVLGAFVLALSPNRRLLAHAASGVCFAAAVLTKETTLLLLPALVYQLWQRSDERNREFGIALFTSLMLVVGAIYPLYALLKGELLPGSGHVSLIDGIRFQLFRPASGHLLDSKSLAHGVVAQWLHLDPWLLVAGAAAALVAINIPKCRPLAIGSLTLWLMLLRPGYLPVPYVIGLLMFAPVMIVAIADKVWTWCVTSTEVHGRGAGTLLTRRRVNVLAKFVVVLVILAIAPSWVRSDARAMDTNADPHLAAAESWILANLPRGKRVLVGETLWIDMVRAGWSRSAVVWFYKLDSDPAIAREFPLGWRDFDYIVSTDEVRGSAAGQLPQVEAALDHSSVVQSFGVGGDDVEVRRINPP
jgi:hypothetical protein